MPKVNKVWIKLDDNGKGSIVIGDGDGEHKIELTATMGVQVVGRANHLTHVTIRLLADVDFEGPATLTMEQAQAMWPEFGLPLNGE